MDSPTIVKLWTEANKIKMQFMYINPNDDEKYRGKGCLFNGYMSIKSYCMPDLSSLTVPGTIYIFGSNKVHDKDIYTYTISDGGFINVLYYRVKKALESLGFKVINLDYDVEINTQPTGLLSNDVAVIYTSKKEV